MKKVFFIVLSALITTSCLTPTGRYYEEKIDYDKSEVAENGKIIYVIAEKTMPQKLPVNEDENYLIVEAKIKLDTDFGKTVIGNYESHSELDGIIKTIGNTVKEIESSVIKMNARVFCSKSDYEEKIFSPCGIAEADVKINDKQNIKLSLYGDSINAYDLNIPVYRVGKNFLVNKCVCIEYKKDNDELYYRPELEDRFAEYQKFQLYVKNEKEENELLAEWNNDTYTVLENTDISSSEIKDIMCAVIMFNKWEKFFQRNDLLEYGNRMERTNLTEFLFDYDYIF